MFADIGDFLLHLSFLLTQAIVINGVLNLKTKLKNERYLWITLTMTIALSFLCLMASYIITDYSVLNVVYNSSEYKPLLYKIAGTWSNHEGSMLLWLLCLVFHSIMFTLIAKDNHLKSSTLVMQAVLIAAFLLFVIFSSNPFIRIYPEPLQGLGMNPLLQDIAVSFHPPILYLGYLGFSLPFSASLAALIHGKYRDWNKLIKTPILFSWFFLSVGISTGAWWAYRELGWGGFWFWDPVENVSLLPWLSATILIHSLKSASHSRRSLYWCLLLSIISFTFVMIGTFIVRSGIINSVHAFAHDPKRGAIILFIITIFSGASLLLFSVRYKSLLITSSSSLKAEIKRRFVMLNNILFSIITCIVFLATLYPLAAQISSRNFVAIEAGFYNLTVVPILLLASVLCAYYVRTSYSKVYLRATRYFLLMLFIALVIVNALNPDKLYIYSSIALYALAQCLPLFSIIRDNGRISNSFLPHLGFIMLTFFVSLHFAFKKDAVITMKVGQAIEFASHKLALADIKYINGPNFIAKTAEIIVDGNSMMTPQIRNYFVEKMQTSETAVLQSIWHDIYITIGSTNNSSEIVLDIKYNPAMNMIWLSCSIISVGSLLIGIRSLLKR